MGKRIQFIDIAKGIGIIMVVWAHAHGPFSGYFYQFHMPFFFLISGYLYNSKADIRTYTIKKVYSLYIPFAFWNILFYSRYLLIDLLRGASTFQIKEVVMILATLSKDGVFMGATWFLGALFVVSVAYKILDTRINNGKYKDAIMIGIFTLITVMGFCVKFPFGLSKFAINRTMVLSGFFEIGVLVKKYKEVFKKYDSWITALLSLIIFITVGHFGYANMSKNDYWNPVWFMAGACMASYVTIYVSRILERLENKIAAVIKNVLIFLGKNSIDIVIWHFVVFHILIAIQMQIYVGYVDIGVVFGGDHTYITTGIWWAIYTVAGICFSLVIGAVLRKGPWGKILKKIHAV